MANEQRSIKHALFHETWTFGDDANVLDREAQVALARDCDPSMAGHLFCPRCRTPLTRRPRIGAVYANGRVADFSHLPSFREHPCALRAKAAEGELFKTEEEARRAVERRDLVVVREFLSQRPSAPLEAGAYAQSQVEDDWGPAADVPLRRHTGEDFRLPAVHMAVISMCKRFDANLSRLYLLPGQSAPLPLDQLLIPVTEVQEECDTPKLYWGRIKRSVHMAQGVPRPDHLRMTYLDGHPGVKDFCLKARALSQEEKGIDDDAAGRILVIWSKVVSNGIGLCFRSPGWGCFALLPEKYNPLLLGA